MQELGELRKSHLGVGFTFFNRQQSICSVIEEEDGVLTITTSKGTEYTTHLDQLWNGVWRGIYQPAESVEEEAWSPEELARENVLLLL